MVFADLEPDVAKTLQEVHHVDVSVDRSFVESNHLVEIIHKFRRSKYLINVIIVKFIISFGCIGLLESKNGLKKASHGLET